MSTTTACFSLRVEQPLEVHTGHLEQLLYPAEENIFSWNHSLIYFAIVPETFYTNMLHYGSIGLPAQEFVFWQNFYLPLKMSQGLQSRMDCYLEEVLKLFHPCSPMIYN
jgi:hypothetical protein